MSREFLGWDIGGAHLKIARLDASGRIMAVRQIACPLWRGVHELGRACQLIDFPIADPALVHAVTMTGELCDVFADRADGVRRILGEFLRLVGSGDDVRVFGGYDGWLSPAAAQGTAVTAVASANWLALAAYTAELVGDGLLVDIGSTTTDIIPIVAGEVRAQGRDDASRMACGELLYTGVVRTPVAATCTVVPFRGAWVPLAGEVFATLADVYRLCGQIDERHDLMPAADGQAKDRAGSARRLARMVGCDYRENDLAEFGALAAWIARAHRRRVEDAAALVTSRALAGRPPGAIVGAGAGRFIAAAIAREAGLDYHDFGLLAGADAELVEDVAVAAPAVAAARLAWMTA
ncbi:MAG: S-layer protein [Gammaproteobacteria bacterium]|nr:S-layer protein [Gammaproteobacteria bacterium]MCP5202443.1 S-layer protein [Gammaproteobacteria bacterium]